MSNNTIPLEKIWLGPQSAINYSDSVVGGGSVGEGRRQCCMWEVPRLSALSGISPTSGASSRCKSGTLRVVVDEGRHP